MKYQIIIIEDDPIFTFLLEKGIHASGIKEEKTTFTNGLKALTYFKENYLKEKKYVIFLDLNMPVMNGWQFMEQFELFANSTNCQVFILTSSGNKLDIDQLMASPLVADFIIKPIDDKHFEKIKQSITAKFG